MEILRKTPTRRIELLRKEAEQLEHFFENQPFQLITILSQQLTVIKQQAQTLMGLCGLAITVTGFSGAHMIRAGSHAAFSMVLGIALILIAVFCCLRILMQLRWVSQSLKTPLRDFAQEVIEHRQRQQNRLMVAAVFVSLGLSAYLLAVVLAALANGNAKL